MRTQDLRLSYQEAIQLIRVGHYETAHRLLTAIDKERPDVKNVLYPLAVCCEALGLQDEGLDYCDRLIKDYDHEKAKAIKSRILESLPVPEEVDLPIRKEEEPTPSAVEDESQGMNVAEEDGDLDAPSPFPEIVESDSDPDDTERSEDDSDDEESAEAVTEDSEDETLSSDEDAAEDVKVRAPFWLVLFLAFMAAAVSAALIHYFILGTEMPLQFLKDLYTQLLETLQSLRS